MSIFFPLFGILLKPVFAVFLLVVVATEIAAESSVIAAKKSLADLSGSVAFAPDPPGFVGNACGARCPRCFDSLYLSNFMIELGPAAHSFTSSTSPSSFRIAASCPQTKRCWKNILANCTVGPSSAGGLLLLVFLVLVKQDCVTADCRFLDIQKDVFY